MRDEAALEDAYARADAAELLLTEARDLLKPLAHHARPGDDTFSERVRQPNILEKHIVEAYLFLQQEGEPRGEEILDLLHDMIGLVGHGNYCECEKTGKPCAVDAVKQRYARLFPGKAAR